jgi:hypothetical protein
LACHLQIDADPNPSYHFYLDPDPAYHFNPDADQDSNTTFQFYSDPCGSGSATLAVRQMYSFPADPDHAFSEKGSRPECV